MHVIVCPIESIPITLPPEKDSVDIIKTVFEDGDYFVIGIVPACIALQA
jgi:hypothetical protein